MYLNLVKTVRDLRHAGKDYKNVDLITETLNSQYNEGATVSKVEEYLGIMMEEEEKYIWEAFEVFKEENRELNVYDIQAFILHEEEVYVFIEDIENELKIFRGSH